MKKILLIDDEVDLALSVQQNLQAGGDYEVKVCNDSLQAVAAAAEAKPDLILLDVVMPEMMGPEVADHLRQNPRTENIPVVFLTAMVMGQEAQDRGNVIGGHFFVAKPVKMAELRRVIEQVLRGNSE